MPEVGRHYGSAEGAAVPIISLINNLPCPNEMAGPLGTTCYKWLQSSKVLLDGLLEVMSMPLGELLEFWSCRCETVRLI